MASWPDGDGAGMCTGSCWPVVSVSAQVVDVSRRGGCGSLGSGRSAGCAIGEGRTSPRLGAMAGICSGPYPGRAPCPCLAPRTVDDTAQSSRRVRTRSDRYQRAASGAYKGTSVFSERPPARVVVLCGLGFFEMTRARGGVRCGGKSHGAILGASWRHSTHRTHRGKSRGVGA